MDQYTEVVLRDPAHHGQKLVQNTAAEKGMKMINMCRLDNKNKSRRKRKYIIRKAVRSITIYTQHPEQIYGRYWEAERMSSLADHYRVLTSFLLKQNSNILNYQTRTRNR